MNERRSGEARFAEDRQGLGRRASDRGPSAWLKALVVALAPLALLGIVAVILMYGEVRGLEKEVTGKASNEVVAAELRSISQQLGDLKTMVRDHMNAGHPRRTGAGGDPP